MNLLEVDVVDDAVQFGARRMPVPRETAADAGKAGQHAVIGVRPEDMEQVPEGQGLPTVVQVVEELGADAYVHGIVEVNGGSHPVIARVDGRRPPAKGAVIHLAPQQDHVYLFSAQSGERLPT
jgi:multiple sugar transport system ATP-binding protein